LTVRGAKWQAFYITQLLPSYSSIPLRETGFDRSGYEEHAAASQGVINVIFEEQEQEQH
jgi:hypothetical protein